MAISEHSITLGAWTYEPELGPATYHHTLSAVLFSFPFSEGRAQLAMDDELVYDGVTGPGLMAVSQPGEHFRMSADVSIDALMLMVPLKMIPDGVDVTSQGAVVATPRRDLQALGPAFMTALKLTGTQRDLVVGGLTTALLGLLMDDGQVEERARGLSERQFLRAARYAEARLNTGLDLPAWAAELSMPVGEFAQRFRGHTGTTPYAWFTDRRIDRAMKLLTSTDLRIVDVALSLGFNSQSHFSDVFRTRVGMSPGRWRRAMARG